MSKFTMRTSCPGQGNKHYIRQANGGWNSCILGKPTHKYCNVLANCVGYANGRFNEIIANALGITGNKFNTLNCNAENWIERAQKAGLKIGSTPRRGAIMCWQKGSLSSSDGAGHVCIVEEVYDNNHVYTSESGYNSTYFWNAHRYNSNGRWGSGSAYKFRGFIYLPEDVQKIIDEKPTPPSPSDKFNIGDDVILNGPIYTSSNATKKANTIKNKKTKVTRKVKGALHPYNTTGDLGWCDESSLTKVDPTPTPPVPPTPTPTGLKVGDSVKIVGYGNSNSLGTGKKAGGLGWTRKILRIYTGRAYPYQVGNSSGTTGFYKSDALKKLK